MAKEHRHGKAHDSWGTAASTQWQKPTRRLYHRQRCHQYADDVVILIGGNISNNAYRSYGNFASETIDYIHINVAILGTKGFKDNDGFTTYENEYELKRHILQQSEKIIVVTDKNKFNTQPEYTYCKFKEVDVFISNTLTKENKSQIQVIPEIIEAEV